jgi:hypothetical protein
VGTTRGGKGFYDYEPGYAAGVYRGSDRPCNWCGVNGHHDTYAHKECEKRIIDLIGSRPPSSELQPSFAKDVNDFALLGGGKGKRKGPRKQPSKRVNLHSFAGDPVSLLKAIQPKYRVIGSSQPIPKLRFNRAVFHSTALVQGSAFNTKTNLAGTGGNQIIGAAAPYGLAFAWGIGDIAEIASYSNIFDQFILKKITLRIKASQNTNTTGTGAILYVVCDFDNATLLTSLAAAESYQNVQSIRGSDVGNGESLDVTITPCISLASNAGNVITPPMWQDVAVTTNRHYGVKCWYQTTATTDPRWDVEAQYHFAFTNLQ